MAELTINYRSDILEMEKTVNDLYDIYCDSDGYDRNAWVYIGDCRRPMEGDNAVKEAFFEYLGLCARTMPEMDAVGAFRTAYYRGLYQALRDGWRETEDGDWDIELWWDGKIIANPASEEMKDLESKGAPRLYIGAGQILVG